MSLKSQVTRLEARARSVLGRPFVVLMEEQLIGEHPEYKAFRERIKELDRKRMEVPLLESEPYRQAELREMRAFDEWRSRELARVAPEIPSRWPDHEVILLTYGSAWEAPEGTE
jgi:hypothetical protein